MKLNELSGWYKMMREFVVKSGTFMLELADEPVAAKGKRAKHARCLDEVLRPLLAHCADCFVYGLKSDSPVLSLAEPILLKDGRRHRLDLTKEVISGYEKFWEASGGARGTIAMHAQLTLRQAKELIAKCPRPYVVENYRIAYSAAAIEHCCEAVRQGGVLGFCLPTTNGVEWMNVFAPHPLIEELFDIACEKEIPPQDYRRYVEWLPLELVPPELRWMREEDESEGAWQPQLLKRKRKDAGDLRPADLEEWPVWEFLNTEDRGHDETLVAPVRNLPVERCDGVVGTKVRLANGRKVWAMLGCLMLDDPKHTREFLTFSVERGGRWFHLSRPFDATYDTYGPEQLAAFLHLPLKDVFPVTYDISQVAVGAAAVIQGTIALPARMKRRKTK